ncbi:MAG: TVP38/TMEM64 family protein [Thermodesulfovibrionales bacterium]
MSSSAGKRIALLAVVAVAVILARLSGLDRHLTLSALKESQHALAALYAARPAAVIAVYAAVYVAAAAFSLPGATALTLAGGGIFGLLTGTVVVSFASSIGATFSCLVSRYLLRDWVQSRFSDRLVAVNQGIEKDGPFYLFSLRLIPVFPFFVINLVMGLTRMPLRTFYWVSQLGMLPATIVYVNAGREIARIESLSSVLSPGLIFSFVLLGLFPITAKKAVGWYSRSKARDAGDT